MSRISGRTVGALPAAVVVVVAVVLLAACAAPPPPVEQVPTVPLPATFRHAEGWRFAVPRDGAPRGPWWQMFGDAELDTLAAQVATQNFGVQAAAAAYRQARALSDQARAGLAPTVTGTAAATRSGSGSGADLNSFRLGANLAWEVDLWGRLASGVAAREAGVSASLADLQAARLSAQALLARNYFQLRQIDAQKQLFAATLDAYQRSLTLTRNRYEAGVAARTDVIQAEALLRSTQVQALALDVSRAQLVNALAVLIGQPPAALTLNLAALPATLPEVPAPGLPAALLERRPDIAAAGRRVAAANANIGVALAANYPAVTLSAGLGLANPRLADLLALPSRFWSLGPALAALLFDGGQRAAVTEQARAAHEATVATYRQTVLTAFREVEDNLVALRILADEARLQDEAVRAARLALELITNQYRAGVVSYLNVVTAQASLLTAERAALQIQGSRIEALIGLVVASGGGWSPAELEQVQR